MIPAYWAKAKGKEEGDDEEREGNTLTKPFDLQIGGSRYRTLLFSSRRTDQ